MFQDLEFRGIVASLTSAYQLSGAGGGMRGVGHEDMGKFFQLGVCGQGKEGFRVVA
jgi:hypothetical protein